MFGAFFSSDFAHGLDYPYYLVEYPCVELVIAARLGGMVEKDFSVKSISTTGDLRESKNRYENQLGFQQR